MHHVWEGLCSNLFIIFILATSIQDIDAINCYTCSSRNGSDVNCEDPYNPALSTYTEKCMVPKQGHIGMFPANFCIKIIGLNVDTTEIMVIRACVMKTMDTQCGEFRYQDTRMAGCILTCDYDGCNKGNRVFQSTHTLVYSSFFLSFMCYCLFYITQSLQ